MSPATKKGRSKTKRTARPRSTQSRVTAGARTIEGVATDAIRDLAAKQGKALSSYGELLSGFGSGKTEAGALSEKLLRLNLEQGTDFARDVIKFGGAYLRLLVSLADAVAPKLKVPA